MTNSFKEWLKLSEIANMQLVQSPKLPQVVGTVLGIDNPNANTVVDTLEKNPVFKNTMLKKYTDLIMKNNQNKTNQNNQLTPTTAPMAPTTGMPS